MRVTQSLTVSQMLNTRDSDSDPGHNIAAGDAPNSNDREWHRLGEGNGNFVPVWCPAYNRRVGPNLPLTLLQGTKHPVEFFFYFFQTQLLG